MDSFYGACALLLVSLASVLILKAFSFKGAPIVAVLFGIAVIIRGAEIIAPSLLLFPSLPDGVSEYASSALKAVGIGYIGGITSDTCRELGESGLAKAASLLAKFEITAVAYPYIREIAEKCLALIGE